MRVFLLLLCVLLLGCSSVKKQRSSEVNKLRVTEVKDLKVLETSKATSEFFKVRSFEGLEVFAANDSATVTIEDSKGDRFSVTGAAKIKFGKAKDSVGKKSIISSDKETEDKGAITIDDKGKKKNFTKEKHPDWFGNLIWIFGLVVALSVVYRFRKNIFA
jgi:hypothetical protein